MIVRAGNKFFQLPGRNFNTFFIRQILLKMKNNPTDNHFSFRRRWQSFRYALRGIGFMIKTQHNFWIHLTIAGLVVIAGFIFCLSITEWIFIIFAIGLVLSAETFNSAIEQLTDLTHPDIHPTAGLVKDLAAGAVLISAIAAAITGLLIFVPKIMVIL